MRRVCPAEWRVLAGTQLLPQKSGIGILGPARFDQGEDVTRSARRKQHSRCGASRSRSACSGAAPLISRSGCSTRRSGGSTAGRTSICVVRLLTMVRHRNDEGELALLSGARAITANGMSSKANGSTRTGRVRWFTAGCESRPAAVSVLPATGVLEDDDGKRELDISVRLASSLADDRTVLIAEGSGDQWQFVRARFEIGPRRHTATVRAERHRRRRVVITPCLTRQAAGLALY